MSSLENPKTKESDRSIRVISTSSPTAAASRLDSSSPPNPAPRTRTDVVTPGAYGLGLIVARSNPAPTGTYPSRPQPPRPVPPDASDGPVAADPAPQCCALATERR